MAQNDFVARSFFPITESIQSHKITPKSGPLLKILSIILNTARSRIVSIGLGLKKPTSYGVLLCTI